MFRGKRREKINKKRTKKMMTKKKIKKNAGTSWENSEQKIKHCNIIIIILCLWNENGDGDGGVAG